MAEIRKLFSDRRVAYEGPFRVDELYGIMRRFFKERNYFLIEANNQEDILPQGKQVFVQFCPEKQLSDYSKGQLLLDVFLKEVKDVTLTVGGQKQKYQQGKVDIKITAQLKTDYRNKFEGRGAQFLFRTLMDKFVRRDITSQQAKAAEKDGLDLAEELKRYLNMHRFTTEPRP